MPRKSSTRDAQASTMPHAFTYSPGDRHTYTWDGTAEYAARYWHGTNRDGSLTLVLCPGERIPMDGVARTATAFMDAVDRWRLLS